MSSKNVQIISVNRLFTNIIHEYQSESDSELFNDVEFAINIQARHPYPPGPWSKQGISGYVFLPGHVRPLTPIIIENPILLNDGGCLIGTASGVCCRLGQPSAKIIWERAIKIHQKIVSGSSLNSDEDWSDLLKIIANGKYMDEFK